MHLAISTVIPSALASPESLETKLCSLQYPLQVLGGSETEVNGTSLKKELNFMQEIITTSTAS